jgi:hypothetical protein
VTTPEIFYEICPQSLNHAGEELCGDQVKVLRRPDRSTVVLSDGLGSGVKANILATLTAAIIVTMRREQARLEDIIETVLGTLPACKVRGIAYAAFVIVEIEHATGRFQLINFDSPEPLFLRQGILAALEQREEVIQGKTLRFSEGRLERGDFLAILSDGVLYAGMGTLMNFGWGREQIGAHLQALARGPVRSAENLVRSVMRKTNDLYDSAPGDDATLVGILARKPNRLMLFTGPPTDRARDEELAQRLLHFDGRKVVCGGTTANLVAERLGEIVETDLGTVREDVPPIGWISGVDLVTEGILTLARALTLLKQCEGKPVRLPADRNGAVLLARELLKADSIHFIVGEQVNPFYQNPLLPRNISIRHSLVEQVAEVLRNYHRAVDIEWF